MVGNRYRVCVIAEFIQEELFEQQEELFEQLAATATSSPTGPRRGRRVIPRK